MISQLQRLASDALFDELEAETLWPVRRNEIAQMKATQRLEQSATPNMTVRQSSIGPASDPKVSKEMKPEAPPEADDASVQDEDSALLGDMFSAVPDDTAPANEANGTTAESITLRNFGKQSGLSPRRVLEETVRARFVTTSHSGDMD
jgi:ATP-dependent RNA helicase DHX29